ncbi:carbohydrate ABC transporter permease [Paenibacillus chungangensis]|uniref:Carbohydrate ABC transporter permease n=1 Tax=Paenibacillus chungangensis TaxID=696535 RepID=A0ABW3HRE9_9BACL
MSVLVTSATAYPLNKTTLLWRKVWISLILFTMLFNGGLIPTYMVVKSLGLIDSLWALIFLNIVSAFNLIIVMNFMRTIPEELDESAMIDGANPIRIFFSITLPLCKPVLATLALWTGVGLWNNFMQALIYLNKKSLMTLPLLLKQIIAGQELLNETGQLADSSTESVIAATIMVAIIPILGIYPFLQRYFTKGIMLGSIKS